MYSQEQKERFISMRASGMSFDKISAKLDISKPTLIKWWFAFKKKIAMLEYANAQKLVEKYCLNRQAQLEEVLAELAKIRSELKSRDISNVNIPVLLEFEKNREEKFAARMAELEKNAGITAFGIDKEIFLAPKEDIAARGAGEIENLLQKYEDGIREIQKKIRKMPPSIHPENEEEKDDSRKTA